MKKLILIAMAFMGLQAQAAVTAQEFTSEFIEQMNHRLSVTNKERIAGKKRSTYCEVLSKDQEKLVKDIIKENPEIRVVEFTEKLAANLKCYPEFWAPWGRKNIPGMVVNSKAYIMDTLLIRDVLQDLNDGSWVDDNVKILDSYSHF